ncbi:hypothetical protein DYB32_000639 [Aphanomyces invadans]|uniref:Guanylate cyclase domain-containing protein n=1 Tax=Aphanomyces invadans TaxID=157072 RepID=A0A3R6VTQ3_9STRA|nr:hypothetical protein DYB32_000639 [Aphanomyces invadans]
MHCHFRHGGMADDAEPPYGFPTWSFLYTIIFCVSFMSCISASATLLRSTKAITSCVCYAMFWYFVCKSAYSFCRILVLASSVREFLRGNSTWLMLDEAHDVGGFRLLGNETFLNHDNPTSLQQPPVTVKVALFIGDAALLSSCPGRRIHQSAGEAFYSDRFEAVLIAAASVQSLVIVVVSFGYTRASRRVAMSPYCSVFYLNRTGLNLESVECRVVQSPLYKRLKRILVVYVACTVPYLTFSWVVVGKAYGYMDLVPDELTILSSALYAASGFALAFVLVANQRCMLSWCMVSDDVIQQIQANEAPTDFPVFVNTDIESSSALWGALGSVMHDAQDMHDNLLRALLVPHHGYEITTAGDAFQLAFHNIADAVAYCLDVQEQLLLQPWPPAFVDCQMPGSATITTQQSMLKRPKVLFHGVRVRMGIHASNPAEGALVHHVHPVTGRVAYVGLSELIGREVTDIGRGGQIIVTAPIVQWVRANVMNGTAWAKAHRLVLQELGMADPSKSTLTTSVYRRPDVEGTYGFPMYCVAYATFMLLAFVASATASWTLFKYTKLVSSCVCYAMLNFFAWEAVCTFFRMITLASMIHEFLLNTSAWMTLDENHDVGGFRLIGHEVDVETKQLQSPPYHIKIPLFIGDTALISGAFWMLVLVIELLRLVKTTVDRGARAERLMLRVYLAVNIGIVLSYIATSLIYVLTALPYVAIGWVLAMYPESVLNFITDIPNEILALSNILFFAAPIALAFVLVANQRCMLSWCMVSEDVIQQIQANEAPTDFPVFVNTDIESSSALWGALGSVMHEAQDIHDNLLRALLVPHHGYEITTAGDAFQLAFHNIADAVAYCLDVQEQLLLQPWPPAFVDCQMPGSATITTQQSMLKRPKVLFHGVRVRMGIHASTPAEGDLVNQVHPVTGRMMYVGLSELIGREVSDIGHGGQIIVTAPIVQWLRSIAMASDGRVMPGVYHIEDLKIDLGLAQVVPLDLQPRLAMFPPLENVERPIEFTSRPSNNYELLISPKGSTL